MALELKGLKGKALKARANLDGLNAAYDKFNTAAPAHAADVESLAEQIGSMQEDLEFAANVMGNSVNGSAASQASPSVSQTAAPAVQSPAAQAAPVPSPDNISPETHTRDSNGMVIEK